MLFVSLLCESQQQRLEQETNHLLAQLQSKQLRLSIMQGRVLRHQENQHDTQTSMVKLNERRRGITTKLNDEHRAQHNLIKIRTNRLFELRQAWQSKQLETTAVMKEDRNKLMIEFNNRKEAVELELQQINDEFELMATAMPRTNEKKYQAIEETRTIKIGLELMSESLSMLRAHKLHSAVEREYLSQESDLAHLRNLVAHLQAEKIILMEDETRACAQRNVLKKAMLNQQKLDRIADRVEQWQQNGGGDTTRSKNVHGGNAGDTKTSSNGEEHVVVAREPPKKKITLVSAALGATPPRPPPPPPTSSLTKRFSHEKSPQKLQAELQLSSKLQVEEKLKLTNTNTNTNSIVSPVKSNQQLQNLLNKVITDVATSTSSTSLALVSVPTEKPPPPPPPPVVVTHTTLVQSNSSLALVESSNARPPPPPPSSSSSASASSPSKKRLLLAEQPSASSHQNRRGTVGLLFSGIGTSMVTSSQEVIPRTPHSQGVVAQTHQNPYFELLDVPHVAAAPNQTSNVLPESNRRSTVEMLFGRKM